ncbi:MAG: histidine kinase, partial [Ruminococcus sp.]|nr:histidine kinase [Ruminococcus sp.]
IIQPETTELSKNFPYISRNVSIPDKYQLDEIMKRMGKFRPEHELNCGSCGYNTCREKAIAIFQGKAEISMCLPFLKDKAESFSDIIVKNTTNGLIVLNDMLEVQQINKVALSITNLRSASDILGDQIVRILDPCSFIEVQSTGRGIYNERVYLAEYQRYIEQTIVPDRNSNMLICIMRDITEEENERLKKESISRQTVEVADKVVEKQMRIVQEIASLLGETVAETKTALSKLKESITNE